MLAGELYVSIRGDHSQLKKDLRNLPASHRGPVGNSGKGLGKLFGVSMAAGLAPALIAGITAAAGAAAAAVAAIGIGKFVAAASNAEESASKFGFVFASQANETNAALDEMASRIRRGRIELKEMASQFGSLLGPTGMDDKKVSSMSVKLTELASDLASFYNTSDAQATKAIFSGLVGETEAMRRYGVQLNATRIEQEAINSGLATSARNLTPAAKMQAIYNLMLKDTAQAQGDAQRTGGSFANSFRNLQGLFTDIAAQIGQVFLPSAKVLVNFLSEMLLGVRDGTTDLAAFGEGMAESLKKGITWFRELFKNVDGTKTKLGEFVEGTRDFLGSFFTNFQLAWKMVVAGAQLSLITIYDGFVFTFKNIGSVLMQAIKLWLGNLKAFGKEAWNVLSGKKNIYEAMADITKDRMEAYDRARAKFTEEFAKNGMSKEARMLQEEINRIRDEMDKEKEKRKGEKKEAKESERPDIDPGAGKKGARVSQVGIAELYNRLQSSLAENSVQKSIQNATEKTAKGVEDQTQILLSMNSKFKAWPQQGVAP